jgi:YHS domain-containing protein
MTEINPQRSSPRRAREPILKAIDPVCGMEVDPEQALEASYEKVVLHFCSETCRSSFLRDPGRYDLSSLDLE